MVRGWTRWLHCGSGNMEVTKLMAVTCNLFHRKCYEPVKRKFNGSRYPVWVYHRFEIKGGVSLQVVQLDNLADNNALLERLKMLERVN